MAYSARGGYMRRFSPKFCLVAVLVLATFWAACGGGTPTANVVDKITINSSTVSLNQGDVYQLSATATTASGSTAIASLHYTSSDTSLLSISTSGLICAGQWDANFIVCTPTTKTGSATITVTSDNGKSASTVAYVHYKVDIVLASGPTDCLSSTATAQMTAIAKSNNPAVCSQLPGSPATPCTIPSDTLGQPTWFSNDTDVVKIDNTVAASGTATAGIPGQTTVYASVANNNSPAITFNTCPIVALSITANSSTDPFSLDKNSTRSFAAVAVDSKGATLTTLPLTWYSSQPLAMGVNVGSPATSATATALTPGTTSILAACTPPTCNRQLKPVYSNIIVGTTNGSSNDTLYAGSRDSVSLVPIDLANNNSVGNAITLPQKPNSMLASPSGTKIAIGSSSVTAMIFDPTTNTSTSLNTPGLMLRFTPDGTKVGFAYTVSNNSNVAILDVSSLGNSGSLPFTGDGTNLSMDFSADNRFAFLTQQSTTLEGWSLTNGVQSYTLSAPASDTRFWAGAAAGYLLGGTNGQVTARATCDPYTQVDSKGTINPVFVRAIPNGSGMLVLDPPNMTVLSPITVANPSATSSCPPVVNSVSNTYPTGITIPDKTKAEMRITADSTKAFISNGSNLVYIYDLVQHTTKAVTLTGSVTESYQFDLTLDSRYAYIGANDGLIHKIDLVAGTDSAQIDPGLKQDDKTTVANPHFVALRHKA